MAQHAQVKRGGLQRHGACHRAGRIPPKEEVRQGQGGECFRQGGFIADLLGEAHRALRVGRSSRQVFPHEKKAPGQPLFDPRP